MVVGGDGLLGNALRRWPSSTQCRIASVRSSSEFRLGPRPRRPTPRVVARLRRGRPGSGWGPKWANPRKAGRRAAMRRRCSVIRRGSKSGGGVIGLDRVAVGEGDPDLVADQAGAGLGFEVDEVVAGVARGVHDLERRPPPSGMRSPSSRTSSRSGSIGSMGPHSRSMPLLAVDAGGRGQSRVRGRQVGGARRRGPRPRAPGKRAAKWPAPPAWSRWMWVTARVATSSIPETARASKRWPIDREGPHSTRTRSGVSNR